MGLRAEKAQVKPQEQTTSRLHLVTEATPIVVVKDSIAVERGYSDIHMMSIANSVAGIRRALQSGRSGTSLEARTTFDETALMVAVDAERIEASLFLLSIGARAEARTEFRKLTSLMSASINGSIDLICLLGFYLKQQGKASHIDAQDRNGNTALHWAVEEGTRGAINSLLYIGANREITNNAGLTPEAYAKALGRNAMARACRRPTVAMPMIRNAKVRALFYSPQVSTTSSSVRPAARRCEPLQVQTPAALRLHPAALISQAGVAHMASHV